MSEQWDRLDPASSRANRLAQSLTSDIDVMLHSDLSGSSPSDETSTQAAATICGMGVILARKVQQSDPSATHGGRHLAKLLVHLSRHLNYAPSIDKACDAGREAVARLQELYVQSPVETLDLLINALKLYRTPWKRSFWGK